MPNTNPSWITRLVIALIVSAFAASAHADSITLAWDASTSPVAGYIVYVGTESGNYSSNTNVGNVTTTTINNLTTGSRYYFAVKAVDSSGRQSAFSNELSVLLTAPVPATMTAPSPGSTLGTSTTFQWNAGTRVSGYMLAVGTAVGTSNLLMYTGTNRSASVNVPATGNPVYVRLSSLISGAWQARDYTYTAAAVAGTPSSAQLTTPAPGSTLSGSSATFQWTAGSSATQYVLMVGTSAGASDLFNRNVGSSLSASATGLPTDGRRLYVQLRWLVGSSWSSANYSYTAYAASTTPPPPTSGTTYSIFSLSWKPAGMAQDNRAVELGAKFTSDVSGTATAVRFYKYSQNSGTHVGSLWSASGQLLARVTFSNETASGWQEAKFSTPVAITANTTYVVSYHTDAGYFGTSSQGLSTGQHTPPLHVPAGGGVLTYGSSPVFPTGTSNNSNYWVDVVVTK